jgi:hypothetical protein
MTTNELMMLLAGIAVSCGVFALLLVIYPRLKAGSSNVVVAAVEAALQPLIFQAIMASYRLSEKNVDQGYDRLKGADKKALADSVYKLLPDRISEYDITFVKSLITKERFQDLVQNCFDQFDQFYVRNHSHFDDQFQQWVTANQSGPAGAMAKPTLSPPPVGPT